MKEDIIELINNINDEDIIEYKIEVGDIDTLKVSWKKGFKFNPMQKHLNNLFDKYKEPGFKINCPRQSGKSTWIAKKAIELAEGDYDVTIISRTERQSKQMRYLIELYSKCNLAKMNITCISVGNTYKLMMSGTDDYRFYDDIDRIPYKNEIIIGTGFTKEFSFIWSDRNE